MHFECRSLIADPDPDPYPFFSQLVCESISRLRDHYDPHVGGPMFDIFIKATNWAKALAETHDEQIQMCLVSYLCF